MRGTAAVMLRQGRGRGRTTMDGMDMRLDQMLAPQQQTVISHRQIVAVRVLQMPSHELTAAISRERDANPAFEAEERESCHHCGSALERAARFCPVCGASFGERSSEAAQAATDYYNAGASGGSFDDDGSDPMLRVAAATGRGDGLLQLLCASL